MADEFHSPLGAADAAKALLLSTQIASVLGCEIERVMSLEVALRWKNVPRQADWPEDVSLHAIGDVCWIIFHSATATQRQHFLTDFTTALKDKLGRQCVFEPE